MFGGRVVRGWSILHDNKIDPTDPDCKFGIYPLILKELYDERVIMKVEKHKWEGALEEMDAMPEDELNTPENNAKYEDVKFKYNYINSKQAALKVFMNTFYGESGNKRSPFFVLQLAGGITTAGQYNLKMVQRKVECAGWVVYYGDSVSGDTPLVLKDEFNRVVIKTIDDLVDEDVWDEHDQFKPGQPNLVCKQQGQCNYEIWADGDWRNIRRVIRHKTNKKMYRVNTNIGCIDVTEGHSLLDKNRKTIKPTELKPGIELLHSFPTSLPEIIEMKSNVPGALGKFIRKNAAHKTKWLSKHTLMTSLLNAKLKNKTDFLRGLFGRNYTSPRYRGAISVTDKLLAQFIYTIASILKKTLTYVNYISSPDRYSIQIRHCSHVDTLRSNQVNRVFDLQPQTQFVYDIETSDGSFLGGVGSLNVSNTDSLYIATPNKHCLKLDIDYYTLKINKLAYWNELIRITFREIKIINKIVNDMLIADNGTTFLRMAYEEALFPVAFLAKKIYYGIPHVSLPNFKPKKLFIRGLKVKKRGVSDMLKKICMGIMWNSVNIENVYTLRELVEHKIDYIYNSEWQFEDFIMTDVYKPNKQNVKVQTFAARMRNINVEVKPYDRFQYVIVAKNPFKYDERGRKKALSVGDRMEFAERAKRKNMPIDLDYYMQNSVNGQLARLIIYEDMFYVEPASDDIEDLKKSDKKILCKF